jgi:hypothetical protein
MSRAGQGQTAELKNSGDRLSQCDRLISGKVSGFPIVAITPEKWTNEAKAALDRLQQHPRP